MYGYFSNYKYESNFNKAKCEQDVLAVKRDIMKYELSPLKTLQSAGDVVNGIRPKIKSYQEKSKLRKRTYNYWSFLAIFAGIHISRMRYLKKSLNEMNLPLYHIYHCFLWSFIGNCFVSLFLSENFRNKYETYKTWKTVYNLKEDFQKAYFLPMLVEEVKKEVLIIKAEDEKNNN